MKQEADDKRTRLWSYVVVALVALLAGIFLGQLSEQASGDSRVNWPHAVR